METNYNPAIEVSQLTKNYGELLAVDHIDFRVETGAIFGFLGPNGAGKTTTVRMLTGVIRSDEGSAQIMGHSAGSLNAKQIAGVVPEMANAYLDLSGWNNLMLMAKLYGVSKDDAHKRANELLAKVELASRKGSLVQTYSKGMKQRLLLCMALISDPQILFLDEPTSGLDVQSARFIKNLLQDINARGKTIFLTTHDMDEANQLCSRVAIINKGKIVAIDTPEKLRMAISGKHSIEISFQYKVNTKDLEEIAGVTEVRLLGDKCRLYTPDPSDLAIRLVDYSKSKQMKIVSLNILAPSLEDAFVALTEGGKP
ncbi:MAG: ATP-binding cassette domain-containing protein [Chloroflexi bacterium]|jgi:ABC-2 type transport system ATP-binding protein|nr:ATP-binding cassette domain-containing protein [Chloroflexota bacterium]MBT7081884.1 ATP-binding cassette domain-containing protein [Chloroflexota bacterium]MBT7288885.1 ATP-binding cassette domain-containing protein [Chloroflexota bacterium]